MIQSCECSWQSGKLDLQVRVHRCQCVHKLNRKSWERTGLRCYHLWETSTPVMTLVESSGTHAHLLLSMIPQTWDWTIMLTIFKILNTIYITWIVVDLHYLVLGPKTGYTIILPLVQWQPIPSPLPTSWADSYLRVLYNVITLTVTIRFKCIRWMWLVAIKVFSVKLYN